MADDLLRFEDNGTISCSVGGTRFRLRRPNIGELRRLWEGWELAAVDVDQIDADVADERQALNERVDQGDADAGRERAGLSARVRGDKHAVWAKWVRDVFDTLGDGTLPESDDDLEPWMVGVDCGVQFLRHWQTVPKASGS